MPSADSRVVDPWVELMALARQLDETNGSSVVPEAYALMNLIDVTTSDPGAILRTTSDPLTKLMFEKGVLHGLRTYLQSANTVHNQATTLISTRKRRLNLREDESSVALDQALEGHDSEPRNAAVYAIANVFRHRVTPDTITLETRVTMDGGVTTSFDLVVGLGLGGLTTGQGWNDKAQSFVKSQHPVEVRPLVSEHLMSLSRLVNTIVGAVRQENKNRRRRN
jgi:hypothetical protein